MRAAKAILKSYVTTFLYGFLAATIGWLLLFICSATSFVIESKETIEDMKGWFKNDDTPIGNSSESFLQGPE